MIGPGTPVAVVGDEVLVATPLDANTNGPVAGAVYAFDHPPVPDGKLLGPTADAFGLAGRAVDADGDTVVVGAPRSTSAGKVTRDPGQVFVYDRDPETGDFVLSQILRSANPVIADSFGEELAIDGDVIAVTTATEIEIFRRSGGVWAPAERIAIGAIGALDLDGDVLAAGRSGQEVGGTDGAGEVRLYTVGAGGAFEPDETLTAEVAVDTGRFGADVAVDTANGRILVGANGDGVTVVSGYLFEAVGDTWEQQDILEPATATFGGVGVSVALDGALAAIGVPVDDAGGQGGGAVYLFEAPSAGTDWDEVFKTFDPAQINGDRFGADVDLIGQRLVVGMDGNAGPGGVGGQVQVWDRTGPTSFARTEVLVASDASINDSLGAAVAVTADAIVAGAPQADTGFGDNQGAAYVFDLVAGPPPDGAIVPPTGNAGGGFATRMASEGAWTVFGAPFDDSTAGADTGNAYVSLFVDGAWTVPVGLPVPPGLEPGDEFGTDVGIGTNFLVVGAPGADDDTGRVFVYTRSGRSWLYHSTLEAPDDSPATGGRFGERVDTSTVRIAVGQPGWDQPNGENDRGRVHVYWVDGNPTPSLVDTVESTADTIGFGSAVDFDWPFLAVGSPGTGADIDPQVTVYTVSPAASDAATESAIYTGPAGSGYGNEVAAGGNHESVAIGRTDNGDVEVYRRTNRVWPADPEAVIAAPRRRQRRLRPRPRSPPGAPRRRRSPDRRRGGLRLPVRWNRLGAEWGLHRGQRAERHQWLRSGGVDR